MIILLSWIPSIFAFLVFFIVASLVSGAVYAMARNESDVAPALNFVSSVVASGAVLYVLWLYKFSSRSPLLLTVIVLGTTCSGLQASIEKSIVRQDSARRRYFVRAFFCYVCAFFYAPLFLMVCADAGLFRFLGKGSSPGEEWGLVGGLLIAPVSISFYRWAFQSLALRPGIDRALREDEVVAR